jgi:hypothetical protein
MARLQLRVGEIVATAAGAIGPAKAVRGSRWDWRGMEEGRRLV